jgi:hypothetical protein
MDTKSLSETILAETANMSLEPSRGSSIKEDDNDDTDCWISAITKKINNSAKRTEKYTDDDFSNLSIKGKGKHKKTKDGLTDYDKEFDTEIGILKSMYLEHNRFVEDLTKEYNNMKASKSSARGVTKYMTDLIESITSARTVSMQVVKELIAAKKMIAELNIKEREKFIKESNTGQMDMNQYASTFMNELFKRGRNSILDADMTYNNNDDYSDYEEYTMDDLNNDIMQGLDTTETSEEDRERELYLKYENNNVTISVLYDDETGDYEYIAEDENGNVLYDYPLPIKGELKINRNNNTAVDEFGQRYPLVLE